ncbi:MAG TPA: alpha/beta fold hydrolase [Cyclobacteriaceae bacterium]|nr:alpha/beta fold hydrolase [Cyclobacteriaceae bacterium]
MKYDRSCVVLGILLCLAVSMQSYAQKASSELVKVKSTTFSKFNLQYLAYKPATPPSGKLPVIIYLHDNVAVGSNPDWMKGKGLPLLMENGKNIPALVVAPQLPDKMGMNWSPAFVDEFVNDVVSKYSVDQDRIYLTGFSMGANGAWEYACAHPDRVAAVVPIGGWGDPKKVCNMKSVATWVFHGANDEIVIPQASKNMVQMLKACGGDVRMTELADVKHEASGAAYAYEGVFEWILSQNKSNTRKTGKTVVDANTISYKLPKALASITGLAWSKAGSDWYGINEKDLRPIVVNFDTTGGVKNLLQVNNAGIISWQDITLANGNLYIADVGNSQFKRKTFQIYEVNEEALRTGSTRAKKIEFSVSTPDPLDFKSIFYDKNSLYLVGETQGMKQRFLVKVAIAFDKVTEAEVVGALPKLDIKSITGSYYNSATKNLLLISDVSLCRIKVGSEIDLVRDYLPSYLRLPGRTQKESITIGPSGEIAFADKNFLGTTDGNLYLMKENTGSN